MSYTFYKFLHLAGLFTVLMSLAAIASHRMQGGNKTEFKNRKYFMILHGIGLTVAFIAGFGLIAKAGFQMTQGWLLAKIAIWFVLGAYPMVFYRQNPAVKTPYYALLALLVLTLWLVEYKPF